MSSLEYLKFHSFREFVNFSDFSKRQTNRQLNQVKENTCSIAVMKPINIETCFIASF